MDTRCRCRWCNLNNPLYVHYHDFVWGRPVADDRQLFELLILESFQAGLSWECVLNKREAFREAFDGFDPVTVSGYEEEKLAALMENPGIIRNRRKLRAAVDNAGVFLEIQEEFGSFYAYLRRFTGDTVDYEWDKTTSPESDALSKDLRKRGMAFVGSTTIYAYLQAIGLIHSHEPDCFLHRAQM